jgi:hypothetical protein
MTNKLTAVEYLQSIEIERDLNLGDWSNAKEIEKQQIIKAAARGFLAMPEKFNLNNAKEFAEQYYKNTYE